MKNLFSASALVRCVCFLFAATCVFAQPRGNAENENAMKIHLTIGENTLEITPAKTAAADALVERLRRGDVVFSAEDYGNFEKVGALGFSLPRADERVDGASGDVLLYQGNHIVLLYGNNAWSYTRLGKIAGVPAAELRAALLAGKGAARARLSLAPAGTRTAGDVSSFDLASGENGRAPKVRLNDGREMPVLGLGTYSLRGNVCKNAVRAALAAGVRLFDTASIYGNEVELGEAIRESGVPREEIFVITKLYPGEQFREPEKAIRESLERLGLGYVDMMLLHHPGENDVRAYKAMERFVRAGKIRSLGLSNWYIEEIDGFVAQVEIAPALVQNEIHVHYQEREVVPYMHAREIVMQAWYPFGGRGHTRKILSEPTIVKIAGTHGVSPAQVILRWHLQRGIVVVPGSSDPAHIRENISVFGFSLSEEEMRAISELDRGEKHDWY